MAIRYYKLFDLLNRRGMKKSDLRSVISSATVAKLSKGEYISGEAIEKICLFLGCQPGDIMEVITIDEIDNNTQIITITSDITNTPNGLSHKKTYGEIKPSNIDFSNSDEIGTTTRQFLSEDYI